MEELTFKLHPAQQDVYLDQLLNLGNSQYNVGGYVILKGALDRDILRKVINEAPAYFDALKMRFDIGADEFIGYIENDYKVFEMPEQDFSGRPDPASAAKAWMQTRLNLAFQLERDNCLFEQTLVKISQEEYFLFGRFHHLVMDGYGFGILLQYMADRYKAAIQSEPIELSFPSYLEEAAILNAISTDPATVTNDNYWQEKIKTRPAKIFYKKHTISKGEIPTTTLCWDLPAAESDLLLELAKELKVGFHQLTIAALIIYFGRTTSADRFLFGLPIHKRNSRKLRKIIGLFNSFLPFAGSYNADQTIAEFIRSVAASQSVDYRHQDFSISNLCRHLQVNPANDNLWELIVNYLPLNTELDFGSAMNGTVVRMTNEFGRIPLHIYWVDYGSKQPLELQINFLKEYFDEAEIELFASRLRYILSQFTIDKNKTAGELSILQPGEKAMLEGFSQQQVSADIFSGQIPFAKYLTHVLDKAGEPALIGVPGELCFSEVVGNEPVSKETKLFKTGMNVSWSARGELQKIEGPISVDDNNKDDISLTPVCIAATFVAEPLEEYINYWSNEFDLHLKVKFAPYNQVFQQLLDPSSSFNSSEGINVLLLRVEDWLREQPNLPADEQVRLLQDTSKELIAAINESRKFSAKPCLFGIIPWISSKELHPPVIEALKQIEQQIRNSLVSTSLFYELDLEKVVDLFKIEEVFDPKSDEAGHIPFTEDFYAALGTFIARRIRAWKVPSYKVIALDCDNTLWKGVCGEVGAMNVIINEEYIYLQEFLINKYKEGFLLVLCSKNNEEDVWDVFDNHPGMKLKREHIVASKINWQPKHGNLTALAKELNLRTESFIFVDDSDIEIEQMDMGCPDVLATLLPKEQAEIPSFLDHYWAFDTFSVTEDDKNRNLRYRAEWQRKEEQVKFSSISDFIQTLNVKVGLLKLGEADIDRAAQLTMRTNQFNLNGIRKSQEEISKLMGEDAGINWVVDVKDKFGDYGIVGLLLAKPKGNELIVDTFLLSCRVLGRNVEDTVLSALKNYCHASGLDNIRCVFQDTDKNKPFIEFLERTKWVKDTQSNDYCIGVNDLSKTENKIVEVT